MKTVRTHIKLLGLVILSTFIFHLSPSSAQTSDNRTQLKLDEAKARLAEYDTEHLLDSLDQEKLPRLVSGGLFGGANMSNFIITRNHRPMSSYMRIGGELGGFLDFRITKHFSIQPQIILTAQQNYFASTDTMNTLWSFGAEIPIYFLGRFGNMEKGYIQFGGGIFTHFTFASNVRDKYRNWDDPTTVKPSTDPHDYSKLYSLHDNHFGVCLMVGYELPLGIQINAQYKISLSDIATFYKEMKGDPTADALFYPQCVSLGIGYRWR